MGSLLRPDNLLEVRATIRDKGVSEEEAGLPAVEKAAIGEVIKMQQELGYKAVTDGEFVRTRFWGLMVRNALDVPMRVLCEPGFSGGCWLKMHDKVSKGNLQGCYT